ncbi:MAG: ABC transporter permease subunit [Verrucomicrobiae bacterium]|nr:ABC transporter permease subunit [Verrucomicrobiae bacterium]
MNADYKIARICRAIWVYALLIGGSAIFAWPFLWMATTSIKVDREMFGETIRLWPQRPIPHPRSPYVDTRYFDHLRGPHMNEILPEIETMVRATRFDWPPELDREIAIPQVARGIYRKLVYTLPVELWNGPRDQLLREIRGRLDAGMVREALGMVRRALLIGQLRARSYDLQEDQLVAAEDAATRWQLGGTARAELVPVADPREPHAELRYDFSTGDLVTLSQTFKTSFPVERLHWIQLYLRPDDTWHSVVLQLEKLGKTYRAVRTHDLADFSNWGVVSWQEPGPDDLTNKIRTWILLREAGPSPVTDPHEMRITLELRKVNALEAWWAKARRNYRFALDHVPFWRYVATSVFLVILNLVGTLFSCSIVAYSFARLQWPGRNFCFALMLATMMVPPQVTMIPYFIIVRSLGWYNTLYPLWVGSFFAGAFNVFLLRQFLKGIPRDLEDAAKIDGCGFWRIYWHIMLPLVKPTLAAIAIFTFMGTWNDFMGPLIYLTDQRLYPIALGLYAFNVQAGGSLGMMMAGSLLMTLPVIVIFFFAQKYFIQGVTLTGMKG